MKYRLALVLGAFALGACSVVTHRVPLGPAPISAGSLDGFSPLVPRSSADPRCEQLDDSSAGPDGRAVALVYAQPAEEQVTVTFDAEGVPIRYTDVRGDLDHTGDRTTIGLYLTEGYAVVSNRPAGAQPTILQVPLAEALSSAELGDPSATLEQVLATCGRATRRQGVPWHAGGPQRAGTAVSRPRR